MATALLLPLVPQPAVDVRPRAAGRAGHPAPVRPAAGAASDPPSRARDERRARRPAGGAVPARGLEGAARVAAADGVARRRHRNLPLLRPAPVRGRVLGALGRLGLRGCRALRQLSPQAAEGPAVLHREHRPAPRPPPQRADPELSAPARPRRAAVAVLGGADPLAARGLPLPAPEAVRRGAEAARRLPGGLGRTGAAGRRSLKRGYAPSSAAPSRSSASTVARRPASRIRSSMWNSSMPTSLLSGVMTSGPGGRFYERRASPLHATRAAARACARRRPCRARGAGSAGRASPGSRAT